MHIDPQARKPMPATRACNGERTPWRRVIRSVMALAGPQAQLVRHCEKPWASITFSGARHTVLLAFAGERAMDAADDFIVALPEHEFTIAGSIVADATVVSVEQRVLPSPCTTVEAEMLLLDDA